MGEVIAFDHRWTLDRRTALAVELRRRHKHGFAVGTEIVVSERSWWRRLFCLPFKSVEYAVVSFDPETLIVYLRRV